MRVAITGGTGFVGTAVVHRLLRRDHEVRALVRDARRAGTLADLGVELVVGDLSDADALGRLVDAADAVVHLVGIIAESGPATFEAVQVGGTRAIVAAARRARVGAFVHMSALGARESAAATPYHRAKWAAEEAVRAAGVPHTILRPSIVAAPGNRPLTMMVNTIRLSPIVPVIGDGRYQLQPIWLDDVAEAFARALERQDVRGTFELGGPERLSYHQLLDRFEAALGVHRLRVSVPVGVARIGAAAGDLLPDLAPITTDQLQMLLEGSVTDDNAVVARFGITPRPFAEVAAEMCAPYAARPAARR
jgi:uncharacterized protein YbjT (DUF2867 family)